MLALLLAALAAGPILKTGDTVDFPVASTDPTLGPATAPVTIVTLTDVECPFCRRAEASLRALVAGTYKGRIRLVHKDFPLDIHSNAIRGAVAGLCAGEQGRFWDMRKALMEPSAELTELAIHDAAASLKLNLGRFESCVASKRHEAPIAASVQKAVDLGFRSTPSFIVNGRVIVGFQLSTLHTAIDNALIDAH